MIIDRYLELGLRLGRHIEGFVDAYYGPQSLSVRVAAEAVSAPDALATDAARLIADLDAGVDEDLVDARRRRWIRAQVLGLHASARKLAGEDIGGMAGGRTVLVPKAAAAHRRLHGPERRPGSP